MKAQTYSRTAQSMAVCRAVEQVLRRPRRRILSDPWAVRLIPSPFWRAVASFPLSSRITAEVYDWLLPGAQEYILARARLVDDCTRAAAHKGLEQLVLLGAGFDTTVFRLGDCLGGVRVFEVDHPATQAVKRARLRRLTPPGDVLFLPVDFEREDFVGRLLGAGFDPARRTLVTWLGVAYYLTAAAVTRTIGQVAELISGGSEFIFDYANEAMRAGRVEAPIARRAFRCAARMGEPFLSGLEPADLGVYLGGVGFRLARHWDCSDLQQRYCPADRKSPSDFLNIALCERQGPARLPPPI
jgi:methyltransferase (TIGR00027 family)